MVIWPVWRAAVYKHYTEGRVLVTRETRNHKLSFMTPFRDKVHFEHTRTLKSHCLTLGDSWLRTAGFFFHSVALESIHRTATGRLYTSSTSFIDHLATMGLFVPCPDNPHLKLYVSHKKNKKCDHILLCYLISLEVLQDTLFQLSIFTWL